MKMQPSASASILLRRFLISVAVLVGIGLVMIYSSSFILAGEVHGNYHFFFYKQIISLMISLIFCVLVSKTKISFWIKYGIYLHMGCLVLLFLTLVPGIGISAKGANRWLGVGGFTFQPGEFVKISMILAYIPFFEKFDFLGRGQRAFYIGVFILTLTALILQPDFGTFFIVFMVLSFVAFLSSFSRKYFYSSILGGIVLGIPILLARPYRVERLFAFLDPWQNPQTSGFQIIQSYLAFANGSFTGLGLGNSNEKLFYLPEAHNDFILSVIGEEMGLLGVTFVIASFLALLYYGLSISLKLKERYSFILCSSLVFTIGLQTVVNMGVVLGLLPTKGLNLPFISTGGSSLLINFLCLGLILSASKAQEKGTYRFSTSQDSYTTKRRVL